MNRKSDGMVPRTIQCNRLTRDSCTKPLKCESSLVPNPLAPFLDATKKDRNISVKARITDSDGHLPLHFFCAESYEHETELMLLQKLLDLNPRAVMQKDPKGNLPLHIAVDRDDASATVVRQLLLFYSKSTEMKNGTGDTPLFLACRRRNPNAEILELLLQASPDMASKLSYGCLPLHQLVHMNTPSVHALRVLIKANPSAVSTPNKHGNLPLHLLCASLPCMDAFLVLLQAYPEAISLRNVRGDTPISVALAKQKATTVISAMHTDFVRLMLRSSAPHTLDREQQLTLRDLNWESRKMAVLISTTKSAFNNDKNVILPHLYSAIPGIWREIICML